jgi:hypothetical protein
MILSTFAVGPHQYRLLLLDIPETTAIVQTVLIDMFERGNKMGMHHSRLEVHIYSSA